MYVKVTVERWSVRQEEWHPCGSVTMELPFANARHYNFVLELQAILNAVMSKHAWLTGRYRLGGDDEAILDWDGGSLRMISRPRTISNPIEKALEEISEAETRKEDQKSRN